MPKKTIERDPTERDHHNKIIIKGPGFEVSLPERTRFEWAVLGSALTLVAIVVAGWFTYIKPGLTPNIGVVTPASPNRPDIGPRPSHDIDRLIQDALQRAEEKRAAEERAKQAELEKQRAAEADKQRAQEQLDRQRREQIAQQDERARAQKEAHEAAKRAEAEKDVAIRNENLKRVAAARAEEAEAARRLSEIQAATARAEATIREANSRAAAARDEAAKAAERANKDRAEVARLKAELEKKAQDSAKRYRVRYPDLRKEREFSWVPLRRSPGASEPKIKDLVAGTAGLIATGNEREVKEQTRTVVWVEVTHEGDTGWVSRPYIELDMSQARR